MAMPRTDEPAGIGVHTTTSVTTSADGSTQHVVDRSGLDGGHQAQRGLPARGGRPHRTARSPTPARPTPIRWRE